MSFLGVDTSGAGGDGAIGATGTGNALVGAPKASLVTTRVNSLTLGVGVDSLKAAARTPAPGEQLVHQYLASAGATFWVQRESSPNGPSGSIVTSSDVAPTGDSYNFSIVEILGGPVSATSRSAALVTYAPLATEQPNISTAPTAPVSPTLSSSATGMVGKDCSPGGLVSIFGTGFTAQEPQSANSYPLPTEMAGVRVKVNAKAMPLLFVSDSQINFQCPLLPVGSPLEITVAKANDVTLPSVNSTMLAAAPDLFTLNNTKQGVILIASSNELAMPTTPETPSRPALAGELLTIYASGLGETQNIVPLGTPAPSDPLILLKIKSRL